ncbi:hypothetical protein M3Y95_01172900 [Aphelenchoides besseyi]|nr:hypothetical protein M3Y95_01172900 [Aphelenchoides besseyi]
MISLLVILMSCVLGSEQAISSNISKSSDPSLRHNNVQDLLVPIHSTTPLICDLIFNQNVEEKAIWFRNGEKIAEVNSGENHVYKERSMELKEVPKVGFLIIPQISLADEGDYWCTRKSDDKMGKVFRIRVSYIKAFDEDQQPVARPTRPFIGDDVRIDCPTVESFPTAAVSWKFDDEPIDFSTGRSEVTTNGSLIIRQFRSHDSGVYECVLSNFAGHTSTQLQISLPVLFDFESAHFDFTTRPGECGPNLRNGILWFLVGCLTTSCVVLLYLLGGLICYKYSSRSATSQFAPLILRASPELAPGFRKVIAPTPDYVRSNANGFAENV